MFSCHSVALTLTSEWLTSLFINFQLLSFFTRHLLAVSSYASSCDSNNKEPLTGSSQRPAPPNVLNPKKFLRKVCIYPSLLVLNTQPWHRIPHQITAEVSSFRQAKLLTANLSCTAASRGLWMNLPSPHVLHRDWSSWSPLHIFQSCRSCAKSILLFITSKAFQVFTEYHLKRALYIKCLNSAPLVRCFLTLHIAMSRSWLDCTAQA